MEKEQTSLADGQVKINLRYDKTFLFTLIFVCLGIIALASYDMEMFKAFFQPLINTIIFKFKGPVGIIFFSLFCFLIWIMFSKYGDIKFGKPDDKPEYSTWAWVCMIFSSGAGFASLLWWSSEGIYHLMTSSVVADLGYTGKAQGVPLALSSGFMEWCLLCSVMKLMMTLCYGLPAFRLGRPFTIAGGLYGLLGEKVYTNRLLNKTCDYIGAFGAAGGPTASMGVGVILLTSGIYAVTGYTMGTFGKCMLIVAFAACFILSSYKGIKKGMSVLSRISVWIPMGLTLWIFVTGPTLYISDTVAQSIGTFFSNFINLSLFTDAGTFVQPDGSTQLVYQPRGWQSFWLTSSLVWTAASAAFTAGFAARISRGRTIREILFWNFFIGMVFCFIFMGIMGSAVCYSQVTGISDVWAMLQKDSGSALFTTLSSYPLSGICSFLATVSCFILGVTTFDAATYFLAVQATGGNPDPSPWMKVIIGCLLGFVAVCFLLMGDFIVLRGMGAIGGVPIVAGSILFAISLVKMCRQIVEKKW
ncbi:MAG: hypothetical protein HDQ94_01715 [Desulfovibrio sp.]|nr:hypothetical protein [Desulfovibrio sp.]